MVLNEIVRKFHTKFKVECRASFLALVFAVNLLGKSESNQATNEEIELLRFLTPLIKLYTGKQVIFILIKSPRVQILLK